MGARPQPEYDFYPDRAQGGRPVPRRRPALSPLSSTAQEAEPVLPGARVSVPPPNIPPVFGPHASPPGDERTRQGGPDGAADGQARPARPVPAYTAFVPRPTRPPAAERAGPPGGGPPPPVDAHGADPVDEAVRWQRPRHWTPPPIVVMAPPPTDVALGRRARRRPSRVSVAAAFAVVLVLGGAAAAVAATPRYLAHRDRSLWAATSVRLPASAAGLPRITPAGEDARTGAAQESAASGGSGQMITDLAVYGRRTGARAVVVVGRPQHPLTAEERELVRSAYASSVVGSASVVLTRREAGPLGGWFGCGVHVGRTTLCLAVDAGAVVSVTVTSTGPQAVQLARDVRAAVELRH